MNVQGSLICDRHSHEDGSIMYTCDQFLHSSKFSEVPRNSYALHNKSLELTGTTYETFFPLSSHFGLSKNGLKSQRWFIVEGIMNEDNDRKMILTVL